VLLGVDRRVVATAEPGPGRGFVLNGGTWQVFLAAKPGVVRAYQHPDE
jgi:hypothetical protein